MRFIPRSTFIKAAAAQDLLVYASFNPKVAALNARKRVAAESAAAKLAAAAR